MKLIETVSELEAFLTECKSYDWIIVPIYCNGDMPVHIDSISMLYVYVLHLDIEVAIIFDHTEGLHMSETYLQEFPTDNHIFVYGKKKFKHCLDRDNLIDMDMVEYFYTNSPIDEEFDTPAHEYFTRNFSKFKNLNTIIPITKHIEKCQLITQRFLDTYENFQMSDAFNSYNNTILDSLYQIESNGLYVDDNMYRVKFEKGKVYDNYAYTEYNPYTTTGRPSNRYGSVNFAALKKDDGSRTPFQSRFGTDGFLVSFDYDAYHLRLLAELVDYQFPDNVSAHKYLATYYFNKQDISDQEYSESKGISFRQLYGGISKEYLSIPFYAKVHEYTKLLWEKYNEDGYIETPMFGRQLYSHFFSDMNASKLLNYLLQSFETERNMAVINNISHRISSYSSKLILYTYDSLLVDFNKYDGLKLLQILKEELEQNGKFPVKIEIGPNYHDMQSIQRKI